VGGIFWRFSTEIAVSETVYEIAVSDPGFLEGGGWRVVEGHERGGACVPLPTGVGSGEGPCPFPEKF